MITWIADRSQLTRLGIISILKQLGHQVSVRELSSPGKLGSVYLKSSSNLLIISASFLSLYKGSVKDLIDTLMAYTARILVMDCEIPEALLDVFGEVIQSDDTEKTLLKRIGGQIEWLVRKSGTHHQDNGISEREKEVLRLVAMGLTNKEIAEKLYISTHTVIAHRKNITAKLGIKTIAGLSVYAVINKLISIEDIH